MRSTHFLILIFLGAVLLSCSEEGNADSLKATELELKKRELDLREKELEEKTSSDEDEPAEKSAFVWDSYYNSRFEFCVEYPTNLLTALGESQNQDGNTFATANRSSEMRASGMHNALEQSIKQAFASAIENGFYYDDERIITYKTQKDNWFVVSGKYNESIFYVRTVLKDDVFYTLYFEYHQTEEKKFSEIIERAAKGFPGC